MQAACLRMMAWSRSGAGLGAYVIPRGWVTVPMPQLSALLPQDLQQVMVSGPNLNETSIVSGGYGGTAEGIIPTSAIKGTMASTGTEL